MVAGILGPAGDVARDKSVETTTARRPVGGTGRRLAPMVAHRLGSGAVVGCSDVAVKKAPQAGAPLGSPRAEAGGVMSFVKPVYGGWLQREVIPAAGTIPVVTLLLDGVEESASSYDGPTAADVLDVPPPAGAPRVRRLEMIPPDARSVDLIHARRIVGAGSGIATEGLLSAVGELAELLEGDLGGVDGHDLYRILQPQFFL